VDKLTTAVMSKLETQNKTLIGAVNELNSNRLVTGISTKKNNADSYSIYATMSDGSIVYFSFRKNGCYLSKLKANGEWGKEFTIYEWNE